MGKKSNTDKVQIKNADELARKLKSYSIKAKTEVEKAVKKGCMVIEGEAKSNAAVDTGYMRASITHQVVKNQGVTEGLVGTNTHYAPFIEYGTRKMEAQPFLRPAYDKHIPKIRKDIKEALRW